MAQELENLKAELVERIEVTADVAKDRMQVCVCVCVCVRTRSACSQFEWWDEGFRAGVGAYSCVAQGMTPHVRACQHTHAHNRHGNEDSDYNSPRRATPEWLDGILFN